MYMKPLLDLTNLNFLTCPHSQFYGLNKHIPNLYFVINFKMEIQPTQ